MFQPFTNEMTMRELIGHPLLKELAPYFVFQKDWTEEMDKPLKALYLASEGVADGLNRLCALRETGDRIFPLYGEEEIRTCPEKEDPRLFWFPSDDPAAAEKPYILLVPGGGYVNVWSLTEGWPVARRFNELGWNVFVLNYRVNLPKLFPRPLDDISRALDLIRGKEQLFRVRWDHYLTLGFSAGANLILNWMLPGHGYAVYGMPAPQGVIPVYPPVSLKLSLDGEHNDWLTYAVELMSIKNGDDSWSIEDHVRDFPPTRIIHCADDDLVNPEHSRILKQALDAAGILSELEMDARGGHGFAEGTGTDAEGWIDRTAAFFAKTIAI